MTIGSFPQVGLSDARIAAKQATADVAKGKDPAAAKKAARAAKQAEAVADAAPLDLIERFLAAHGGRQKQLRPRTTKEVARLVRHDILPPWRGRRLSTISRADAKRLLNDIVRRGPVLANQVATVLTMFGKWAIEEEVVTQNPFAGLPKPAKEVSRDRVLGPADLAALLTALDGKSYPVAPLVTLLLLLGARRTELAEATWSEFDLDGALWRLPRERSKNKRARVLPLPDAAVDTLRKLPRFESTDFVFTFDGIHPATGLSHLKLRLDKAMSATLGRPVEPWVFHDLRRSTATGLQRLGVRLEVTECILGHSGGSRAGVVGVYQRHEYLDEQRAALEAWSAKVRAIESGEATPANVVGFGPR